MKHKLFDPIIHYADGNKIRSTYVNILQKRYNIDPNRVMYVNDTINTIHNCSLVIDDIQDNATLRRGKLCSHKLYGIDFSLASSYLKLFEVLKKSNEDRKIITDTLYDMHFGQLQDIMFTKNKTIPTLEKYLEMTKLKTGSLFSLCTRLLVPKDNDIHKLSVDMGTYYQIKNDIKNLTDSNYWQTNGKYTDIVERRLTFPILVALEKDSELGQIYFECESNEILYNMVMKHNESITNRTISIASDILQKSNNLDLDIQSIIT